MSYCCTRVRFAKSLQVALLLAGLACGSGEGLHASGGVHRIGRAVGYKKVDGVSRAVIAGTGPVSLEVEHLPPSRIHVAAALMAGEAAAEGGPIRCTARMSRADGFSADLVSFELAANEPRWVDATGSSPAIERGTLNLDCEESASDANSVVWAQPLAVPQDLQGAPPLIVLVSLDTLRSDHVTGFGGMDLTPNLGALADEGLRLVNTVSEGTWTLASHYSLLFSRMYGFPVDAKPLTSLAQALADGGFVTAALTGGGFMSAAFNYHLGFDHFAEHGTGTDDLPLILTDVLPTLRRFEDAPSFLFLHTFAIHELPPTEVAWHEKHGTWAMFHPRPRQMERAREFYAAIVRQADQQLAAFIDALREISQIRPVLLVIVSDHGDAFGEHRNFRHGFGHRRVTLHDEVIHVPMIIWGPGLIPAGRSLRRPAMLLDVAPSILAAAGIAPPSSMRGTDLWPLWSNDDTEAVLPSLGSVSHTEGAWSLRTEKAKLIVEMTRRRGNKGFELYDLESDPGELDDLAAKRADEVAAMRGQLRQRLSELGVPLPANESAFPKCLHCSWQERESFWQKALEGEAVEGATVPKEVDEETLQRLRELGYID